MVLQKVLVKSGLTQEGKRTKNKNHVREKSMTQYTTHGRLKRHHLRLLESNPNVQITWVETKQNAELKLLYILVIKP